MAESLSHKFGQIIGEILELAIEPQLQKFANKHKLYLDKKGVRKARSGKKVLWTDDHGNKHCKHYPVLRFYDGGELKIVFYAHNFAEIKDKVKYQ
jgi:hypothetical protein